MAAVDDDDEAAREDEFEDEDDVVPDDDVNDDDDALRGPALLLLLRSPLPMPPRLLPVLEFTLVLLAAGWAATGPVSTSMWSLT